MTELEQILQARDDALKAREEGRVLIFPAGVTLDEAKRLHAEFMASGGGNIQFPLRNDDPHGVIKWLLGDRT